MSSILDDVKHVLGLLPEDTAFDVDVMMHINTALSILTQLGVGPVQGYRITGKENQWNEFTDDPRLDAVRSYIYLKVKLMFDPPLPSVLSSMERQLDELVYRINVVVDYG